MLVGFLLFFTTALAITLKNTTGINIYLRGETVLGIVNQGIERQMQKEFPVLMAEIKSEVPSLVEKYTQDFISIGKLEIGGYTVNLPPQFIQELEDDLRRDVTFMSWKASRPGKTGICGGVQPNITENVLKILMTDLNSQVIRILTRYYSIPVVVWLN